MIVVADRCPKLIEFFDFLRTFSHSDELTPPHEVPFYTKRSLSLEPSKYVVFAGVATLPPRKIAMRNSRVSPKTCQEKGWSDAGHPHSDPRTTRLYKRIRGPAGNL